MQHGNWITEVVDIPADTPEDMILSVAILAGLNIDAAGFWLHNSMDDDCPEVDALPRRLQAWTILEFDADEVTEGTDIEQAAAAMDHINLVLQREPYGLGARLDELPVTDIVAPPRPVI